LDARALSAATGIDVATMNAWISRGYVPGIAADAQGRRRDFDTDMATHIAIMSELSKRLGIGAPLASRIASEAGQQAAEVVVITPPVTQPHPTEAGMAITNMRTVFLPKERDVPKTLSAFRKDAAAPPTVFVLVYIKGITARMLAAQQEWERARGAKADD
jgi:hypothetical protein